MRFSITALTAFLTLAESAVIYKQATSYEIVTAPPTDNYVTVTADPQVKTVESTVEKTVTLYRATTKPVTLYTGTIFTILSTVEPNRVQPIPSAAEEATPVVSNTLSPSQYTAPVEITPTAPNVPTIASTVAQPSAVPSSSFVPKTFSTVRVTSTQPETSSAVQVQTSSESQAQTSSEPQPQTSSQPQPQTSSQPQPQTSSQPQPQTSSEPQPQPSSEPQPQPSSEPQPQPSSEPQPVNGITYSDGTDLFRAISTDDVPSIFPREDLAISLKSTPSGGNPIHTNKFYTNFILDDQTMPAYVQPYTVWWTKLEKFYGLGISHTTNSQRVFGPDASVTPVEYFINPVGLVSFAFSASEFSADNMGLSLLNSDTFSTSVQISSDAGSIQFPLVQGMGFVTAIYDGNLTPMISTQLGVNTFVRAYDGPDHVQKYIATLFNEVSWIVYVTVPDGDDFSLSVDQSTGEIVGSSKSKVTIQLAVLPDNTESDYDQAAGLYPTSAKISGSVSGSDGASFSISYNTEGYSTSGNTIIHALPHHLESLTDSTSGKSTSIKLDTTTKGEATGFLTNSLEFFYQLNQNIQFLPSAGGDSISVSADALKLIASSANSDLADDFGAQTNLDSTYFAGKGFDKLAYVLLVVNDILGDADVSKETLDRLKTAFSLFTDNKQINPLMYDTLLKGVTSTAAQGGDTGTDFGSPYYNDHHFHYGYFIHAAAVIGYVDKQQGGTWAADNKDWVNSLVRDVANPSSDDSHFPVFRSFDWYNGHSWAKGLFASSDGKDEESTSEDYNFAYGMKLWGKVIQDGSMEARGDLMLSVLAKSLDSYFYFKADNKVQPAQFIGNCVPGITFENKLDYTTYFGTNREYIHGIHMIPLTPVSGYMRTPEFAQHEWDVQNLSDLADSLGSGWRGILKSNQAIFDPVSSYNFFAQDNFSSDWIDGGASKTWYLAYTAALGGSTSN